MAKPIGPPQCKKCRAYLDMDGKCPRCGAPTKYRPEFPQMMIDYFSIKPWYWRDEIRTSKKGEPYTVRVKDMNDIPFFNTYCMKIDISQKQMLEWVKDPKKGEFSKAYKICKDLQKNFLIQIGARGLSNPAMTIFTAKNITDMRDTRLVGEDKDNKFTSLADALKEMKD